MKNTIKSCVRLEDGSPVIFFSDNSVLGCYTKSEGHSVASRAYMYSLPLAEKEVAIKVLEEYNADCCECVLVLAKRLSYK